MGNTLSEIGKTGETVIIIDAMDRLSELPESILHHIMSFLDSPKERVRMSVLSKKWFALTATFPILEFHMNEFISAVRASDTRLDSRHLSAIFYKYIDYTTSRFCEQDVSAHTFHLNTTIHNSTDLKVIDRCIGLILMKGVKVLMIDINEDFKSRPFYLLPYYLPDTLLSVSSLTSLTISNCELPSSFMANAVKFKTLKVLVLLVVHISEEVIKHLTTSCPLLEVCRVLHCHGFERFCVYGHKNLQEVSINYDRGLEVIDIQAPNLRECDFFLVDGEMREEPSMNLASCKQLRRLYLCGYPFPSSKWSAVLLSNFPFLDKLLLILPNQRNRLKFHSPSSRKFVLETGYDLEEIDINALSLLLFGYSDMVHPYKRDSAESKACMECYPKDDVDTLWFQELRRFMAKTNSFKVLKLHIRKNLINVEELNVIHLPPYELEHVELELDIDKELSAYVAIVDAVLWCCRPQSLSIISNFHSIDFEERSHVVKFIYEKLLQQEDQDRTNIKVVLSSSIKAKMNFSNLTSLLEALPRNGLTQSITFRKEEVVQEI